MYNFVMIFEDTNIPPNKITVQIKAHSLTSAKSQAIQILGKDNKLNDHVFVRCIGVQEIPEIEEDE